jgi:hypothetical protein
MIWFGFQLGKKDQEPADAQPSAAEPTVASPLTAPTVVSPIVPTIIPTITPLPVAMPTPAPTAATETSATAMIEAGPEGLNIRSGPGINFTLLAHVEPGVQFEIVGRCADWWQVDYNGTLAWVADWVATASNADGVPEVVPPASPIPPPPTAPPTAAPVPTSAATPTPDARGIVANVFSVRHAPGPYGNAGDIWFDVAITNESGGDVVLAKVGVWVEENGAFQVSGGVADPLTLAPGQRFDCEDHLYASQIPSPDTYHLWLRVCFTDGYCVNLEGPVEIIIG